MPRADFFAALASRYPVHRKLPMQPALDPVPFEEAGIVLARHPKDGWMYWMFKSGSDMMRFEEMRKLGIGVLPQGKQKKR